MPFHYVWFVWSAAFLVPWAILFVFHAPTRRAMWQASLATALFGLTEPIFVPRYWNPPSLFELAQRTGFDLESEIFAFAIGGIAVVLYNVVSCRPIVPLPGAERHARQHRWHRVAIAAPFVIFWPLYVLPWNPIYAAVTSLALGALASVACRPDLIGKTATGGVIFLLLYGAFIGALRWLAPGYIETVWNLPALSGVLLRGIPLEELLFGFTFGMYWASVYEHLTWHVTGLPRSRFVS